MVVVLSRGSRERISRFEALVSVGWGVEAFRFSFDCWCMLLRSSVSESAT